MLYAVCTMASYTARKNAVASIVVWVRMRETARLPDARKLIRGYVKSPSVI
jgi:hypothetical protein